MAAPPVAGEADDDSDYGYDFSAEDEDLIHSLIADFALPSNAAAAATAATAAVQPPSFVPLSAQDLTFTASEIAEVDAVSSRAPKPQPKPVLGPRAAPGKRKLLACAAGDDMVQSAARPMPMTVIDGPAVTYPDRKPAVSRPRLCSQPRSSV